MVLIGLLASAVSIGAQQPPPPQPPPGDFAPPEMTPGEVQRIFDGYLVIQAQEALGLTDQQFAQFVPRLKTLQDTRRRNQQERMRLLNELQRLTNPRNPRVEEAPIKERLNALQELEARAGAELRKAYNALDEILDPRQQARFRVFEEQLERKKMELLIRARQNPVRPNLKRPPG
jgi:Spy/CpxP family protein refolding chaperone